MYSKDSSAVSLFIIENLDPSTFRSSFERKLASFELVHDEQGMMR
jgi:hypothetical protein